MGRAILGIINDLLALVLEIAAICAFAAGAWHVTDQPVLRWPAMAVAVMLVVIAWGRYAAPKAKNRLAGMRLIAFKLMVFGGAAACLLPSAGPAMSAAFLAMALVQLTLAASIGRL